MVETLLDRPSAWTSSDGPESDVVFATRCRVSRNLSDFPFPHTSTDSDLEAVSERVLTAIETAGFKGVFMPWKKLGPSERLFFAEKWLAAKSSARHDRPGGLYVSEDLSTGIAINDENHVTVRSVASGLQPQDLWTTISALDDALGHNLTYAFSERLGFLTPSLRSAGTGLDCSVVMHLPSLEASGVRPQLAHLAGEARHGFAPAFRAGSEALADLFIVSNESTLGRSEEETVFHLKHLANDLIARERNERAERLSGARLQVEDRIGRALGQAQNARLLALDEGLRILSSLRLGIENGLREQYSYADIAETLVASQEAHLSLKCGHPYDDLMLNADRATLFRNRFA